MQFPVSVKGVLFQRGTVVLLENERAEWELPGGRLERGDPRRMPRARDCRGVGMRREDWSVTGLLGL
jgi:8-oxo-dGTP pyrophosphatase MutT (NUDIX family)